MAQGAIAEGRVTVAGAPADKPARLVGPGEALAVRSPDHSWASRGGLKLDAALDRFGLDVTGHRCLDAGASTGGFTDVLLARGAGEVWAVDVGRGQLHERLRRDGRVITRDRTNIRLVTGAELGGAPFETIVADLSFISLRTVAPVLAGELAAAGAELVWLVKPQFEAGRRAVSAGKGVIRDPDVWRGALDGVLRVLCDHGAAIMGAMTSPVRGADGNVEFLIWCRAHGRAGEGSAVDDVVAGALAEAVKA